MLDMFVPLLLILPFLQPASSECDSYEPLSLPVTNVGLSDGTFMRGILSSVGTPARNISIYPRHYFDDTWLFNSSYPLCGAIPAATGPQCQTLRGGLYDPSVSSTSKAATDVYSAEAQPWDMQNSTEISYVPVGAWANDDLNVGNVTLAEYPLGMAGVDFGRGYITQAVFGLDSNSTLLSALQKAGRITSRSYSWWWGLEIPSAQIDGSIVFGGYDAAKISGPNYSMPIQEGTGYCPGGLYVNVADINLGFPNGTVASLMAGATPFAACLEPEQPVVLAIQEEPYFNSFERLTQTSYVGREANPALGFWGMLYEPNNVFDGNFSVSFTNGLTITFPNDVFVVSPQYVASDGSIQTNESVREVLINPLVDSTAVGVVSVLPKSTYVSLLTSGYPVFGRQFFSQAYLTVDRDTNNFFLSEVNATSASQLVSLGASCTDEDTSTSSTSSSSVATHTSSASARGPTSSRTPGQAQHGGLATGAIVGIAIGGVIGSDIMALVAIVYCVRHTRRKRSAGEDNVILKSELDGNSKPRQDKPDIHEPMSGEVQEMGAESKSHELASGERPQELLNGRLSRHWNNELPAQNSPVEIG